MLCNFIEIALRHGYSPVNLLHIFGISFPKNTCGGLLYSEQLLLNLYPTSNGIERNCQKIEFYVKDFFSKCEQSCSFLSLGSQLLKKSIIKNFSVCEVEKSTICSFLIEILVEKNWYQRLIQNPVKILRNSWKQKALS